jgi:putative spermidine/putrescine transport system substrate-binding protein
MLKVAGTPEGELNLIAWAGYAENGSNDPSVDWVTPFTEQTSCKVNVKVGNTSDEMVTLMKTGQYDGVSASGDATLRLIYGGDVAPVNTDLVPNYSTISEFLKKRPWNSVNGQMYGIPHGWGANLLMSRTDVVTPPPDSWGAVFDASSPYKGKVTAYDSPIYIADAALYLKATKPTSRSRTRTSWTTRSSRPPSTCSSSSAGWSASTGRTTRRRCRRSRAATPCSAPRGR